VSCFSKLPNRKQVLSPHVLSVPSQESLDQSFSGSCDKTPCRIQRGSSIVPAYHYGSRRVPRHSSRSKSPNLCKFLQLGGRGSPLDNSPDLSCSRRSQLRH